LELTLIIAGVLIAIIGGTIYVKSGLMRKELTLIYSSKLIETKPNEGVEMLYLDKPISHFIRYEITLFNSGNRDIKPADFAPEPELAFHFNDAQVVSEKAGYASEGAVPHYQIESPEVVAYFEKLKPNQYMTVEIFTGSHSSKLTPPVCNAVVRHGSRVRLHEQVFDDSDNHARYRHLTKHTALMMLSFALGVSGLAAGLYSKYQTYFAGKELGFEQQFIQFLSIDSWMWIGISGVSIIALLFSIECLKVIAPKFRRYKFEHLIQNRE